MSLIWLFDRRPPVLVGAAVAAVLGAAVAAVLGAVGSVSHRYLLLTLYRHQIANTPAWPLSLRAVGRVLAYLVIPPLAWAAAALVENSLGNWL